MLLGLLLALLLVVKIAMNSLFLRSDAEKIPSLGIALAQGKGGQKDLSDPAPGRSGAPSGLSYDELKKMDQDLKTREQALKKREEELLPLKKEIDERMAELTELQTRLTAHAKSLADREQALEDNRINHLVELYSAMEPAKAAVIMENLKIETVIRILRHMKGKAAGQVLAMIRPEKGAIISEKLGSPE